MKNSFSLLKSKTVKSAAVVAAILASGVAAAQTSDTATAITAAAAEGTSNVTLAVAAVVGICALVFGLGIITSLFRR
jgi:hypothetical protein